MTLLMQLDVVSLRLQPTRATGKISAKLNTKFRGNGEGVARGALKWIEDGNEAE
uniref:Uncharacterized protein n=1 Tax=Arundo donax TaxID=35708 RepID=A0A0A9BAF9_ARUDO